MNPQQSGGPLGLLCHVKKLHNLLPSDQQIRKLHCLLYTIENKNLNKPYFQAFFITNIIIVTVIRLGLGSLRLLPIDLEDALAVSICVLVFPDHEVRLGASRSSILGDGLLPLFPTFPPCFSVPYGVISEVER
jgi:hypothetical protein